MGCLRPCRRLRRAPARHIPCPSSPPLILSLSFARLSLFPVTSHYLSPPSTISRFSSLLPTTLRYLPLFSTTSYRLPLSLTASYYFSLSSAASPCFPLSPVISLLFPITLSCPLFFCRLPILRYFSLSFVIPYHSLSSSAIFRYFPLFSVVFPYSSPFLAVFLYPSLSLIIPRRLPLLSVVPRHLSPFLAASPRFPLSSVVSRYLSSSSAILRCLPPASTAPSPPVTPRRFHLLSALFHCFLSPSVTSTCLSLLLVVSRYLLPSPTISYPSPLSCVCLSSTIVDDLLLLFLPTASIYAFLFGCFLCL